MVENLEKLLEIVTQENMLMFDGTFCKQTDGVAMGSRSEPTPSNIFFVIIKNSG